MDSPALTPTRRPRKSGSQKRQRSHLAGMFCTPEERAQLQQRAERAGLSVAAYMRHQCLGEAGPRAVKRPPVERQALAVLINQLGRSAGELGKCGSNVNQIARALNSDRESPHDIDDTLAELRAAMADIRTAALAVSATLRGNQP
jgi:hypothetical protein